MKIVVLDGYTSNPGDLTWEEFAELGDIEVHDRTPEAQIGVRAQNADVLLTNKTILNRPTIEALPHLRYIGVLATGFNVVDVAAARARAIPVCNVPEYGTANVAQAVFALLLELTNRTGHHAHSVGEGRWTAAKDFCYWDGSLIELHGLTLGVVGYGRIGRAVGEIGRAFGMRVLALRRHGTGAPDAGFADLETLLRESDVLSLHCPLTDETREMVNAAWIARMKPSAFLINTARGALINEPELATALNSGRIAGAGLDVLSTEPPSSDNPLLGARNCIITPHIAWATREARSRLLRVAAENICAWQRGHPQNVVNKV